MDNPSATMMDDLENVGQALAERDTAAALVGAYNEALDLYLKAHRSIARANRRLEAARTAGKSLRLGTENYFTASDSDEVNRFGRIVQMVPEDEFMRTARKLLSHAGWSTVVQISVGRE